MENDADAGDFVGLKCSVKLVTVGKAKIFAKKIIKLIGL